MPKKFSIKEALKFGWNAAINHMGFFVLSLLGAWIITLVISYTSQGMNRGGMGLLGSVVSIISMLVSFAISLGFIKTGLRLSNGQEPTFNDFVPVWPQYWQFVLAAIIFGAIVFVGFVLLIVPGIIAMLGLQFYGYFLAEKGMGAVPSLKASWQATKGSRGNLFLLLIVNGLVCLLGLLVLGIGLFVALPTVMVATAYVYRKLAVGQEVIPGV